MTREIPWPRLAAEAVVIVFSILAAFAIDAGWAAKQDADELEGVLEAIAAGLEESQVALEQHIEQVSGARASLRSFIEMTPADIGALPAEEAFLYVEVIQRPYTQDNNLTFLRRALEAGVLRDVDDDDFQAALIRWREAVNQVDEIDGALSAHWIEALEVLGSQEGVRRAWAAESAGAIGPADVRGLRQDPSVLAISARKAALMRTQLFYLPQLAQAKAELLAAVEEQRSR